jgi:hypothetical protein
MTEKRIKIFLKFLLFGILLSVLASCTKDGDDDYTLPRDRYRGEWIGQAGDGASYRVTISSDPSNLSQVIIENYCGLKGTVMAIVTEGTITVPKQTMQGIPGTYWCEALGTLSKNGKTISWNPYIAYDINTTCTYTKQ